jgi:hypothetical protein
MPMTKKVMQGVNNSNLCILSAYNAPISSAAKKYAVSITGRTCGSIDNLIEYTFEFSVRHPYIALGRAMVAFSVYHPHGCIYSYNIKQIK